MSMVIATNTAEVIQLAVGGIVGSAVSITMSKHGMSLFDPETRWKTAAILGSFLFCFLAVTDLLIN